MMRNVALGAVIGFGVMVVVLSIVGRDAPPKLPPPPIEVVDAGPPPPPPAAPAVRAKEFMRPTMMAVPTMRSPSALLRLLPHPDAGAMDAGP